MAPISLMHNVGLIVDQCMCSEMLFLKCILLSHIREVKWVQFLSFSAGRRYKELKSIEIILVQVSFIQRFSVVIQVDTIIAEAFLCCDVFKSWKRICRVGTDFCWVSLQKSDKEACYT